MTCPNCGVENPDASEECASCQIFFKKWEKRGARGPEKQPPPTHTPAAAPKITRKGQLMALGALAAAMMIGKLGLGGEAKKKPPPEAKSAAAASTAAAEAAAPTADYSQLEPLFAQLRGEGRSYGTDFTLQELKSRFDSELNTRHYTYTSHSYRAGIRPEKMPVTASELAREKNEKTSLDRKCLVNGHWLYNKVPDGDTASQCWVRGRTNQQGDLIMIGGGGWKTQQWVRRHWHPVRKAWATMTPRQEIQSLEYYLNNVLTIKKQMDARAKTTARLEKLPALAKAARSRVAHDAIFSAYDIQIKRLAMRQRLQREREALTAAGR